MPIIFNQLLLNLHVESVLLQLPLLQQAPMTALHLPTTAAGPDEAVLQHLRISSDPSRLVRCPVMDLRASKMRARTFRRINNLVRLC